MSTNAADYRPGDSILDHTQPGADRAQIALFSEGTEDPNPIHVDEEFAKAAGFPAVLQQGPMTTAHFARELERVLGRDRLKSLDIDFTAPVFPDEPLTLKAVVDRVDTLVHCALAAEKADGTLTARGQAAFLPDEVSR